MPGPLRLLAAVALVALLSAPARANVVLEVTGGTEFNTFFPGQSFTTPGAGPYSGLAFNFFGPDGTTPTAAGTLFLLSQAYAGTPAALGGSTPGLLAQSVGVTAGQFVFDPGVTLAGGTQYFVYANTAIATSGRTVGTYPGGSLYTSFQSGIPFTNLSGQDANFRLTSQAIPEPSVLALAGVGLLAAAAHPRNRRRMAGRAASAFNKRG